MSKHGIELAKGEFSVVGFDDLRDPCGKNSDILYKPAMPRKR